MEKRFLLTLIVSACFLTIINSQSVNHWETVVYNNDTWKYFVGTSEPDTGWRSLSFDDTAWAQGTGGFGYSDDDDNTVIPACISVYCRVRMFWHFRFITALLPPPI